MRHELFVPGGVDAAAQAEYGRRRLKVDDTIYLHVHATGEACNEKCHELRQEETA